jgi:hypothetical protein
VALSQARILYQNHSGDYPQVILTIPVTCRTSSQSHTTGKSKGNKTFAGFGPFSGLFEEIGTNIGAIFNFYGLTFYSAPFYHVLVMCLKIGPIANSGYLVYAVACVIQSCEY